MPLIVFRFCSRVRTHFYALSLLHRFQAFRSRFCKDCSHIVNWLWALFHKQHIHPVTVQRRSFTIALHYYLLRVNWCYYCMPFPFVIISSECLKSRLFGFSTIAYRLISFAYYPSYAKWTIHAQNRYWQL